MSIFRQISRKLSGPRCHVTPEDKVWVERRMLWLKEQFGSDPVRRAVLEPTSEFLPNTWDASHEAATDLFRRLCTFMLLDPAGIDLVFYSGFDQKDSHQAGEESTSGPVGLYLAPRNHKKPAVALAEEGLARPADLAATICHELGHVHLLGSNLLKRDEPDAEPLTDLLTIYFGAGILTANSAFEFTQLESGTKTGWQASAHGYLPEPVYGYALACFTWLRGERNPQWQKHLRQNIRYYFDDSLHFLNTTSETTIPFDGA